MVLRFMAFRVLISDHHFLAQSMGTGGDVVRLFLVIESIPIDLPPTMGIKKA